MDDTLKNQIDYTIEMMETITEDVTVPRNIKKTTDEARQKLISCKEGELNVNISTAIYLMQEISNDINMPAHTRTDIWSIISELEAIREKCKG